jgi:hypothetical protein
MSTIGELPRALQPWRPWLGWFELELAVVLGDLVRRLADLIGDSAAASGRAMPEPDGLGDLRNRGSYERLVTSEWLLAEEMPEEFLRRAASSEHLFYAPSHRQAKIDRRVIAIFDCGPRQLGAPRLAHLAAWILLARRATELGGELRWGVLQEPGRLRGSDEEQRLKELLQARRLDPGHASHVEQWRGGLEAAGETPERARETEIWWVGATDASAPRPADRRLSVHETLERGTLEATFAAGGNVRRTRLPLPTDSVATALLRGRIEPEVALRSFNVEERHRIALSRPPLFSRGGKHVGVPALIGHAMLVLTVPTLQRKRLQRRRQEWSALRQPVAAMLWDGQGAALCTDSSLLYFWQVGAGFGGAVPRVQSHRFEPTVSARWMPMAMLKTASKTRVCVLDRQSRLVAWDSEARKSPSFVEIDLNVFGLMPLGPEHLAYATAHEGRLCLRDLFATSVAPGRNGQPLCVLEEARPPVWLSAWQGRGRASTAAVAVRRRASSGEAWWLMTCARAGLDIDAPNGAVRHEINLQPGERVVGVMAREAVDNAALVLLSANKRVVRLAGPNGTTTLYQSVHTIMQCSICPVSHRIALLTNERELVVIDPGGSVLMMVRDAEEPAT